MKYLLLLLREAMLRLAWLYLFASRRTLLLGACLGELFYRGCPMAVFDVHEDLLQAGLRRLCSAGWFLIDLAALYDHARMFFSLLDIFDQYEPVQVLAAAVLSMEFLINFVQFSSLPDSTKQYFARAGKDTGYRSGWGTWHIYNAIPQPLRALGPVAIGKFRDHKHWSHVKSRSNNGNDAAWNGLFEWNVLNWRRGYRNMKIWDVILAQSINFVSAVFIGVWQTLLAVPRGRFAVVLHVLFAVLLVPLARLGMGYWIGRMLSVYLF